jgi:hypothetical protein
LTEDVEETVCDDEQGWEDTALESVKHTQAEAM